MANLQTFDDGSVNMETGDTLLAEDGTTLLLDYPTGPVYLRLEEEPYGFFKTEESAEYTDFLLVEPVPHFDVTNS